MVRLPFLSVALLVALLAGCGGSHAVKGGSVSLHVAAGHPQTAVPNVIGQSTRVAVRELVTAGFNVREHHRGGGGAGLQGRVLSQVPKRGVQVDTGSTVKITVGR
jgi:beta-lactam-binding protein with PASTA domain